MHRLIGFRALAVAAFAVVAVGAVAFLVFAPVRPTSAGGPFNPTGVFCMDGYLDLDASEAKGDPPDPTDLRSVKYLIRIEPSGVNTSGWDVTTVAYQGPGTFLPTKPPSADPCKTKGDDNSLNPSVEFDSVKGDVRPTGLAKLVVKDEPEPGTTNLDWEICQPADTTVEGAVFVLTTFSLVLPSGAQDLGVNTYGQQEAFLDADECTTAGTRFVLSLDANQRCTGVDCFSDWDGGGRSDWAELTFAPVGRGDPFDPSDDAAGGVGGIAEIDDTAGSPLGAGASSSGTSAWLIAAVAAAAVAGATALGGAAIFARRRIDR